MLRGLLRLTGAQREPGLMPTILLPTFLKFLLQPTIEKARDFRRYSQPGGYDFYHSLKKAAHSMTVLGKRLDHASLQVLAMSNDWERAHNVEALRRLDGWLKKRKGDFFEPPKGLWRSPNKVLTVTLRPEFGLVHKDKRKVIALWNTKDPQLTPTAAGIGIYMMQTRMKLGAFADCSFHVLDLREGRLYGPASISNHASSVLAAELALAEKLLEEEDAA
jgi:hypothetical protein